MRTESAGDSLLGKGPLNCSLQNSGCLIDGGVGGFFFLASTVAKRAEATVTE